MSANLLNSTQVDDNPFDYDTTWKVFLSLSIVSSVVWTCTFVYGSCQLEEGVPLRSNESGQPMENKSYLDCRVASWVCLTPFMVGCILLTLYASNARETERFDYYGPMRVKELSYYTTSRYTCSGEGPSHPKQRCYNHEYLANLTMEWGYNWACDKPKRACVSVLPYTQCADKICTLSKGSSQCSVEQLEASLERTKACIEPLLQASVKQEIDFDGNFTLWYPYAYDPHTVPDGTDWPFLYLYGDCEQCKARSDMEPEEMADKLRLIGGIFVLVAVVSWACICFVEPLLYKYCDKRRQHGRQNNVLFEPEEAPANPRLAPTTQWFFEQTPGSVPQRWLELEPPKR